MDIEVQLFGRFRDFSAQPALRIKLDGVRTVAEFRHAFEAWACAHWPDYPPGLLQGAAIATETELLHADSAMPADGRIAILPPVSGG